MATEVLLRLSSVVVVAEEVELGVGVDEAGREVVGEGRRRVVRVRGHRRGGGREGHLLFKAGGKRGNYFLLGGDQDVFTFLQISTMIDDRKTKHLQQ